MTFRNQNVCSSSYPINFQYKEKPSMPSTVHYLADTLTIKNPLNADDVHPKKPIDGFLRLMWCVTALTPAFTFRCTKSFLVRILNMQKKHPPSPPPFSPGVSKCKKKCSNACNGVYKRFSSRRLRGSSPADSFLQAVQEFVGIVFSCS